MAKLLLEKDLAHPWNSQLLPHIHLSACTPLLPVLSLTAVEVLQLWALAQRQKLSCPEVALDESPDSSLWD